MGQPVVLIEIDARGEREVRAHADEQTAPLTVAQVAIVLLDPPSRVLEMPPVVVVNRNHDARRLACRENYDDLVRLRPPEVPVHEVIAALVRGRLDDRRAPVLR